MGLAQAAGAELSGWMRDQSLHVAVARSAFRIQNAKSTLMLRALLEMHILKSKGAKHLSCGPLLEVERSKKCMPLWLEAHFKVKMLKAPHVGLLLDVRVSFFVPGARGERETEGEGEEEGEGEVAFPGF